MTFTVDVAPDRMNYISFKFRGSKIAGNSLHLFQEDQMIVT